MEVVSFIFALLVFAVVIIGLGIILLRPGSQGVTGTTGATGPTGPTGLSSGTKGIPGGQGQQGRVPRSHLLGGPEAGQGDGNLVEEGQERQAVDHADEGRVRGELSAAGCLVR